MSERGWRVDLAPAAVRQLRKLPPNETARLRAPILALGIDPHPPVAVRLAGTSFWRLRVGDRRVVCAVDAEKRLVVILRVARRAESTYRRIDTYDAERSELATARRQLSLREVREAEAEYEAGPTRVYQDVEELIADLELRDG